MKSFPGALGFVNFTTNELPTLMEQLSGKPLMAIFGSYRKIDKYPNGPVETGYPDLAVHVVNGRGGELPGGELGEALIKLRIALDKEEDSSPDRKLGRILRGKEQTQVNQEIANLKPQDSDRSINYLLCLYCGPTGRHQAVDTAQDFRTKHPHAIIIGTSCICEMVLEFETNPFDYFLQAETCGLEKEMAELLLDMIAIWR